jgi:excisionase family DNA binding protein
MKLDKRPIMTVMELADYLRVHPTTIYRLLKLGQLPAFKVGSEWRFTVESIDRSCLRQLSSSAAGPQKCALKVSE